MYALTGSKSLTQHRTRSSWTASFIKWAEKQDDSKLTWLAITLAGHGCVITPLTVMIVMATTQNFALFMAAIGAMALSLVTNLASLPTKITIPAFFISVFIDIAIVAITLLSII